MRDIGKLIKISLDKTEFPTICLCSKCGGTRALIVEVNQPPINDPELAFHVALVEHGYYLKAWEGENVANKYHFPHPCTCEEGEQ